MQYDSRPIGVFDSGVGGLTVLRSLLKNFPNENFIYLGDTARLPYGSKSPETIRKYSEQIIKYLIKENAKAVVIACNTASSHFTETLVEQIPIFNVIEPGAWAALQKTKSHRIGVLGTRATVSSASYTRALQALEPTSQVFAQACPLFVPLAEEGLSQDPITNLIAYRYVQPLTTQGIDTLILGCTHYPILKEAIQKAAGNSVELIESGEALSEIIMKSMQSGQLHQANSTQIRTTKILTTDASEHFQGLVNQILNAERIDSFELVNI